jgi:hypothetical protein
MRKNIITNGEDTKLVMLIPPDQNKDMYHGFNINSIIQFGLFSPPIKICRDTNENNPRNGKSFRGFDRQGIDKENHEGGDEDNGQHGISPRLIGSGQASVFFSELEN